MGKGVKEGKGGQRGKGREKVREGGREEFHHMFHPTLTTGCKAELTWGWLYPKIVYPRNTATYIRNKRVVAWLRIEPATESRESTTSPSHQSSGCSREPHVMLIIITVICTHKRCTVAQGAFNNNTKMGNTQIRSL